MKWLKKRKRTERNRKGKGTVRLANNKLLQLQANSKQR
uniref:Uncharacterized protein n=1 Tax=Rhizophora mucronata TaxID=61149 RepID=A0A2P2PGM9_RHIMU